MIVGVFRVNLSPDETELNKNSFTYNCFFPVPASWPAGQEADKRPQTDYVRLTGFTGMRV
jgi:hypothetical protein